MASNLPINPKTGMPEQFGGGGFLGENNPIRKSMEASAAAEGFGKDERTQEFIGITTVFGRMSRKASRFIQPVVDAVGNNLDSMIGLKQCSGLIIHAVNAAQEALVSGATNKTENTQITRALGLLSNFVGKHTQFQTRIKQSLKNVARQKVDSIKQGMIDDLQNSPSMIKRIIGKQLDQRFGEAAAARQKQLLEAQATTADTLVPPEEDEPGKGRPRPTGGKPGLLGGLGSRESVGRLGGAGASAAGGSHVHRTLAQILTVDKGILKEVTKLAEGEEEAAERAEQLEQAGERERESGDKKKSLVERVKQSPAVKKATSWFENITSMFGGGLKGILTTLVPAFGTIASIATAVVGPALTALGSVLAVVGAAFVGWKVGQWINKMTGASDKIGDAANWIYSKVTGKETEGEHVEKANQFVIDQAWEHGGKQKFAKKEHMSLDEARKIQNEWSALSVEDRGRMSRGEQPLKTAPAAAPTPTPAAATPEQAPIPSTPLPTTTTPTPVASTPAPAPAPPVRVAPAPQAAPKATTPQKAPSSGGLGKAAGEALMMQTMAAEGVSDPTEQAALLAHTAHESGGFRFMEEIGPKSYFAKYDGRMGNGPGEGYKYRGRGFIQLTGKNNYREIGRIVGADLVENPDLAAQPAMAAKIAVAFWKKNVRPKARGNFADIGATTKAVQGGTGHIDRRASLQAEYASRLGGSAPVATLASAAPSAGRAAGPIMAATSAARVGAGSSGRVLNAPSVTNVYNTTAPAQAAVIPPAIRPKNDNDTLRAVQGVNTVA